MLTHGRDCNPSRTRFPAKSPYGKQTPDGTDMSAPSPRWPCLARSGAFWRGVRGLGFVDCGSDAERGGMMAARTRKPAKAGDRATESVGVFAAADAFPASSRLIERRFPLWMAHWRRLPPHLAVVVRPGPGSARFSPAPWRGSMPARPRSGRLGAGLCCGQTCRTRRPRSAHSWCWSDAVPETSMFMRSRGHGAGDASAGSCDDEVRLPAMRAARKLPPGRRLPL